MATLICRHFGMSGTKYVAVHMIIMFDSTEELLACYEIMKPGSIVIDP